MEIFVIGCLLALIYFVLWAYLMPDLIDKMEARRGRKYKNLDEVVMPHVIVVLTLIVGSFLLMVWL